MLQRNWRGNLLEKNGSEKRNAINQKSYSEQSAGFELFRVPLGLFSSCCNLLARPADQKTAVLTFMCETEL